MMHSLADVDVMHPINRNFRGCAGVQRFYMALPSWSGGGVLRDLARLGSDGAFLGMDPATDWMSSEYGPVLDFDGSNDRVNCSTAPPMTGDRLSVSQAIFPIGTVTGLFPLSCRASAGSQGYEFRYQSSAIGVRFQTSSTSYTSSTISGIGLSAWHFITVTWDNGTYTFSANKAAPVTGSFAGTITPTTNLYLAAEGNQSEFFKGRIHCTIIGQHDHETMYDQWLRGFPDALNHTSRRSVYSLPAAPPVTGNRRRRQLICGAA